MTTSDINKFGSSELKVLVEDLRRQRESLEKKEKTLKEREEELISRLEKASGMTPFFRSCQKGKKCRGEDSGRGGREGQGDIG
ncbi:MAG: hypothetical protein UX67_C0049G0008 [Candidatus Woesebacteria bacterium GW2011_GWF2_46_8]|uniref:Uncharacterized protein n=1 Tax=Candidatus Woesebacteria bacterium GW2011_GWF2_46_8 TaxID=1618604 RepID=A0A0G1QQH9_9BACT|nr:MAG: hypothetical protein UX67_C0049G0008 [Candidatus Woesebacteria bacterium GW2011_GWF2_46_8]